MDILDNYIWLLECGIRADKIANFGCWQGTEAIVLLWLFDASENMVVDIDSSHLNSLKELEDIIRTDVPERLQGRTIETINRDISRPIPEFPSEYFDLAFCDNVLYILKSEQADFDDVQNAINEMARVVRPGGWVVAVEPKMNVTFEERYSELVPRLSYPFPLNDPTDISALFENAGLVQFKHNLPLQYTYTYQKPPVD